MYVTLLQLVDLPGAAELAQSATPQQSPVVDTELMELTLTGGDRSAYTSDQIAVADQVLTRITDAISEADQFIDGYLARRYSLPLPSIPGILVPAARAIVRYRLRKDQTGDVTTNPVLRDYRDAVLLLASIANGQFSLGVDDPQSATSATNEVQINPGSKVFGRESLRHC